MIDDPLLAVCQLTETNSKLTLLCSFFLFKILHWQIFIGDWTQWHWSSWTKFTLHWWFYSARFYIGTFSMMIKQIGIGPSQQTLHFCGFQDFPPVVSYHTNLLLLLLCKLKRGQDARNQELCNFCSLFIVDINVLTTKCSTKI